MKEQGEWDLYPLYDRSDLKVLEEENTVSIYRNHMPKKYLM